MVDSRNRRKATDARQHSRKFRRRGQVQIPPSFAKPSTFAKASAFAKASTFAKATVDKTAGRPGRAAGNTGMRSHTAARGMASRKGFPPQLTGAAHLRQGFGGQARPATPNPKAARRKTGPGANPGPAFARLV